MPDRREDVQHLGARHIRNGPRADPEKGVALEAGQPALRVPAAAPAGPFLLQHTPRGLGERRHTLQSAFFGNGIAARARHPAVDQRLLACLGQPDELRAAESGGGKMKRDPLSTRKQRFPGDDRRGETGSSRRLGQEDAEVIRMSQWAEVRHLHLVEGVPKREIARRLQLDIKTVRRAVAHRGQPDRAAHRGSRAIDCGRRPGHANSTGSCGCQQQVVLAATESSPAPLHRGRWPSCRPSRSQVRRHDCARRGWRRVGCPDCPCLPHSGP